MNIYEKITAIMANVKYLQKDDQVKFGTTNYKAMSEEKVTHLMHQQLVDQKLVVYPIEQIWSRSNNITHVDVKYRIVNGENPEEFIEVVSCGDGADTQDKGSGKAMTYAFKYMWLRTFAIPTGEDPDKISNEEIEAKAKTQKEKKTEDPVIDQVQLEALETLMEVKGYAGKNAIKGKANNELTVSEYDRTIKWLGKQPNKEAIA